MLTLAFTPTHSLTPSCCLCVQSVLTEALFRMAGDHPYHCMYPLIALSNGDTEEGEPAAKNAHIRHTTNTARVSRGVPASLPHPWVMIYGAGLPRNN